MFLAKKIVEEFGISVSTLNNSYTKLRHNFQTVCKNTWVRNKMTRAEHGKVKLILMEWYRMAKTGSSTTCACKKKVLYSIMYENHWRWVLLGGKNVSLKSNTIWYNILIKQINIVIQNYKQTCFQAYHFSHFHS